MSVWDALKIIPEWPARYFFTAAAVAGLLLLASASPWAAELGFGAGAPSWARLALTVATVTGLVAKYRGIPGEAVDRIDRVLSDRDFMFRNGGPATSH